MGALFLKDLGEKTRRGQIGRVAKGRIPGGLSYGYRRVTKLGADSEPDRGLREIDEAQAAVVRRIFRELLAGRSPRAIALSLNEEGVPSLSGHEWRANTINGNRERGNAILHNELYAGVISYNRHRFVRDPKNSQARCPPSQARPVGDDRRSRSRHHQSAELERDHYPVHRRRLPSPRAPPTSQAAAERPATLWQLRRQLHGHWP